MINECLCCQHQLGNLYLFNACKCMHCVHWLLNHIPRLIYGIGKWIDRLISTNCCIGRFVLAFPWDVLQV